MGGRLVGAGLGLLSQLWGEGWGGGLDVLRMGTVEVIWWGGAEGMGPRGFGIGGPGIRRSETGFAWKVG